MKTKVNRRLLRKLRADRDWSLADAAYHIGISRQALHYIERGMVQPRGLTLQALAKAYKVDVAEFYNPAKVF